MGNWSLPTITDLYTNFLAYLKARDDDSARMMDSRVTAPTNMPDYSKRWNDTTKTIQNWLASAWSNLVMGIAGGGTGATTAAAARTNLDVYSKAEADAAFVTALIYAQQALAAPVTLAVVNTRYTGPSVSLAAGTWDIKATVTIRTGTTAGGKYNCAIRGGSTDFVVGVAWNVPASAAVPVAMSRVVVLGATTTVYGCCWRTEGTGSALDVIVESYSTITAVKIS